MIARVVENQRQSEALLESYTYTEVRTEFKLDKKGKVKSRHTSVYYVIPTRYKTFYRPVCRDGRRLSEKELRKQDERIAREFHTLERRAKRRKSRGHRPHQRLSLAEILSEYRFTPIGRELINGYETIVYEFEPKPGVKPKGDLKRKLVSLLKGKFWINEAEAEIVRVEMESLSPIKKGPLGLLLKVGKVHMLGERAKINNEIWLPRRWDISIQARALFFLARIHYRRVSQFRDYLKATTDVQFTSLLRSADMVGIEKLKQPYPGSMEGLKGVSLEISTGIFGLPGPDGAGKATLRRILVEALEPTAGGCCPEGVGPPDEKERIWRILDYLPPGFGPYPQPRQRSRRALSRSQN